MILEFIQERNREDKPMTRDRIAELEAQYPDTPRRPKVNG